jgi:hypothetical protein
MKSQKRQKSWSDLQKLKIGLPKNSFEKVAFGNSALIIRLLYDYLPPAVVKLCRVKYDKVIMNDDAE